MNLFREEIVVNKATTERKNTKRTCYGMGAFLAVFLSVALVLTSFDFTVLTVRAEESGGTDQGDADEPEYVTDAEGRIIIDGFGSLEASKEHIELDEKIPLEDLTAMMPSQIYVNVKKEVPDPSGSSSSGASGSTSVSGGDASGNPTPGGGGSTSGGGGDATGDSTSENGGSASEGDGDITQNPPSVGGGNQLGSGGDMTGDSMSENGGSTSEKGDAAAEASSSGDDESQSGSGDGISGDSASESGDRQLGDDEQASGEITGRGDGQPDNGGQTMDASEGGEDQTGGDSQEDSVKEKKDFGGETDPAQGEGGIAQNPTKGADGVELLSEDITASAESAETGSSGAADTSSKDPAGADPSESQGENPTETDSTVSTDTASSEPTETDSTAPAETNPTAPTETTPSKTTEASPAVPTETNPSVPSEGTPPVVKSKKESISILIDVTWECADYETVNQESYAFIPKWNSQYVYTGAEGNIPTITVKIKSITTVSTQEELRDALNNNLNNKEAKIVLTQDIALTTTLEVPADFHGTLDGGGHSLSRGDVDGVKFTGIMVLVEGAADSVENTEEALTITNLCVNGRTDGSEENNRAGAPAIKVNGALILDEGARVEGNYNYGTKKDDGTEEIRAIGGGLLVFGRLRIREGASVTGNFAEEGGGGVYLAPGAGLYLHADVILNNKAGADRKGTDLYASAGSFVSHAPLIDLENKNGGGSYYIDTDAKIFELGPDKPPVVDPPETVEGNVEVFLSVHRDSGYTDAEIAQLKAALNEKGITVITPGRTDIDTTDLRNWYVYDHYEPLCWGGTNSATIAPQAWEDVYGGNPKRKYYPYLPSSSWWQLPNNGAAVNTIEEWLGRQADYTKSGYGLCLAQFKEHIYSGKQDGLPQMTFVGYGRPAYVDFLYYDPESNGEKVVDFDVDSSKVQTHTLQGTGFLVNAGVDESGNMHGYLVYYTYSGTSASTISLCNISGLKATDLHNRSSYSNIVLPYNPCTVKDADGNQGSSVRITGWRNEMSIQIVATPESIVVRQQPKDAGGNIDDIPPILTYQIPEGERDTTYSGFGPLVAYTDDGHTCPRASAFTYSNLHMYFTNPVLEREDMLTPLQEADYTQEGDQRYFLNLFGKSTLEYNEVATFGQYQELLYIMQHEGVALITDRDSPFEAYLGGNLCEVKPEGGEKLFSIEELVNQVISYVAEKESTTLNVGESGLTEAEPKQSVGNIRLKSLSGSQIRTLKVPAEGYAIQIEDMSYRKDGAEPSYSILKPGAPGYVALNPVGLVLTDDGQEWSANSQRPFTFIVTNDEKEWPVGEYTIRQRFPASSIYGYSYFTLAKDTEQPPVITPEPPVITPEQPKPAPVPAAPSVSYESEGYEEFEQLEAPPSAAAEPKTGDRRLPPMPVAMGACTVFMLKLILWMYEMEMGITDQVKEEMLRALIDWAKDTTPSRMLLALAAISIVLVVYHLFKELNARRKRMAVKRREK